jgi:hypothetical protein
MLTHNGKGSASEIREAGNVTQDAFAGHAFRYTALRNPKESNVEIVEIELFYPPPLD